MEKYKVSFETGSGKDKGKVFLVGAGPGDPGLFTLRGVECLSRAEVVVYDYLASPKLLDYAPPEAERIYVGKQAGKHTLSQEEINRLIVARAQAGCVVVRLKGGDPFVFGRGGEEALALAAAGVPFEVVPGVTSVVAVPAYAGIPLTHRDYTSGVAIFTGHEGAEKAESSLDWEKIAGLPATLVFLMGVGNLKGIAQRLMQYGRSPKTPVACIQWGTTPRQRTVVGTLADIGRVAEEAGLRPPAVIVVGEVVRLRERLDWFSRRPLSGRRIVVTRAREQASALSSQLSALGAEVLEVPTIKIEPPESYAALDEAVSRLAEYDWVVFTSVNGVECFFQRVWALGKDVRIFAGVKVCAIGPATAGRLEDLGLRPDFMPREYRAEGIVAGLGDRVSGLRVLIPRAEEARQVLPEELARAGAEVTVVAAYRTVRTDSGKAELIAALEEGSVAAITFTSSSTVRNLLELLGRERLDLLSGVVLASIGPITSRTLAEWGLQADVQPEEYTIPALVEALVRWFTAHP